MASLVLWGSLLSGLKVYTFWARGVHFSRVGKPYFLPISDPCFNPCWGSCSGLLRFAVETKNEWISFRGLGLPWDAVRSVEIIS